MEKYSLEVKEREVGKTKDVRKQGLVPGVVYGHGFKNRNIMVDRLILEKLYERAGESSIIDLTIGSDKPVPVIIQGMQNHPVKGQPIHVDFRQIRMDEKVTTEIELEFVGESAAVRDLGGTLIKNFDGLEVECLPKDLVSEIQVDLSALKTFDDIIRIKDLNISEGIKVFQDQERTIATVAPPVSEEELEAMEKAPEEGVEGVKVVGEEEKEKGEEAEEGKPEEKSAQGGSASGGKGEKEKKKDEKKK